MVVGASAPIADPTRLALIARARLLEGAAQPAFDRLARLVTRLLDVPAGTITVVHPYGQTFAGAHGLTGTLAQTRGTPLSHSYCQHVVGSGMPLVIGDARQHPLTRESPAISDHGAIAYAGLPIVVKGEVLGTLCAIDSQPRRWNADDIAILDDLVAIASSEIDRLLLQDSLTADPSVLSSASDSHFNAVFTTSPTGMLILSPEGDILRSNAAMQELSGRDESDLLGRSFTDLVHPDDRARAAATFRALVDGDVSDYQQEERCVSPSGEIIWGRVTAAAVRTSAGLLVCVILMKDDLTVEKETQSELAKREMQLAQARKMDSLGKLASGIAHDFNNMLTVITAYSGMALSDAEPGSEMHENLTEVESAARKAAMLTRQLLAFGRQNPRADAVIDVNEVVTDIRRLLSRVIPKSITIDAMLEPDLRRVRGDRTQVEQVIMNLAINARDAMPQGGTLTLATRNASRAPATGGNPRDHVVLTVSDTGVGIPPELTAKIFEPFFTSKPEGAGTGLGLATVATIAARMGGTVEVASHPGRGASFSVWLPATDN